MFLRRWTSVALLAAFAVGLSACTTLYEPNNSRRYPAPYPAPDARRGPVGHAPADDYRRTAEYRNVGRDADAYTDFLDRELRLNGGQEHAVEYILERRAKEFLRHVHPRDHRYVYPFPRNPQLSRAAKRWWDGTDREIERTLSRSQRGTYRHIARDLERTRRRGHRHDDHRYDRDWDD